MGAPEVPNHNGGGAPKIGVRLTERERGWRNGRDVQNRAVPTAILLREPTQPASTLTRRPDRMSPRKWRESKEQLI